MIRTRKWLLPAALTLTLTACASGKEYPSLALRPAERISGDTKAVTPEPSPPPAPPSQQFTSRLSQLLEQARDAHQRFASRRGNVERLVAGAGGGALGGESWSVASAALADLEGARSDAMIALAELDRLYASESIAAAETGNTGNADAAAAAREQVNAWLAEEDGVLAALHGRLRG